MKFSDYRCTNCKKIFEVTVNNHIESFPEHPKCEHCGSSNSYRIYSNINFDVAEGKGGNSKNGYSNGIVDHPSSMIGRVKGKKIKIVS